MNTTNKVDWAAEVQQAVLAMKEEGQKAYTFMKQEAPEVADEYLHWQIFKGFAGATPLVVASIISIGIAVKAYRTWKKELATIEYKHDRGQWGFGTLAALFAACFFLGGAMSVSTSAFKAIVAPRITILEGIKEVVR